METNNLNPITQSQVDWVNRLISDLEKTGSFLKSMVGTAEKLNYFTPKMRRQVRIQSRVRKLAIEMNTNGE